MTSRQDCVIDDDDIVDVVLHDEIKYRAYELYALQVSDAEDYARKDELQSELLWVAYAVAKLQQHSNGERRDGRAVRAAQVYLRALSSFIGQTRLD